MSDLLRSAFNYFSQPPQGSGVLIGKTDHPLVGTTVDVGPYRVKIRSLIAEGNASSCTFLFPFKYLKQVPDVVTARQRHDIFLFLANQEFFFLCHNL